METYIPIFRIIDYHARRPEIRQFILRCKIIYWIQHFVFNSKVCRFSLINFKILFVKYLPKSCDKLRF